MTISFSDDVRKRAREICALVGQDACPDPVVPVPGLKQCDPTNCYIWELIEMGRKGSPE